MKYGNILGVSKGVSRLILGCGTLNSTIWYKLPLLRSPKKTHQNFAFLDSVVDAGCTAFDTAAIYGDSEATLGHWIKSRSNREKIALITKGGHPDMRNGRLRLNAQDLRKDIEQSLSRLRTDYIDIYLLHRDDSNLNMDEIAELIQKFKDAGKIHAFGVSNWTYERIEAFDKYLSKNINLSICASSSQFSIIDWQKELWPGCISVSGNGGISERAWYVKTQLPLLAWSPLASGLLSDDRSPFLMNSNKITEEDSYLMSVYGGSQNQVRIERARELSKDKELSLAQVSLAYLFSQVQLNLFAVVGCSDASRFLNCMGSLDTQLSKDELSYINADDVINSPTDPHEMYY